MRKLILIAVLSFSTIYVKAQVVDSIKYFITADKPRFFFQLNNRGSFVQNKTAATTSLLLGLSYSKRVKAALTSGKVSSKVYKQMQITDTTITGTLGMWFIGGHFEYSYFKSNKWEISIPIDLAITFSNFSYKYGNNLYITPSRPGIMYEASTTVIYKPFYLIGIGGGVGYRISYFGDSFLTRSFTSVVYNLEFKVYFGDFISRIKK